MKFICVGRNYSDHAKEMGSVLPEDPVIFLKPDTALLRKNEPFFFPEFSKEIHYECELIFHVGMEGKYVNRRFAWNHLDGIGLGIDFTARDLQTAAKKNGLPWTLSKAFNHSAPVSEFLPLEKFPDKKNIHFRLDINGVARQNGNSKDMVFDIPFLIEFITKFITIKTGDIIFTGTPAGVGPVQPGDKLQGFLENEKMLDFDIR